MVNLKKLNGVAEDRTSLVKKQLQDIYKKSFDVIPKDKVEDKKDKYFASIALVLENFWKFSKDSLLGKHLDLKFSKGKSFHDSFLEAYSEHLREQELKYAQYIFDKVSGKSKDADFFEKLDEEERAYVYFMLEDVNPKPGKSVLSSFDALFMMTHIADLIENLLGDDGEKFEQLMNSREVKILINSLMINDAASITSLMKVLAFDRELKNDHKGIEYRFNPQFFRISEDGKLQIYPQILEIIKRAFSKSEIGAVRRNCPAANTPETANAIFDWVRNEIVYQHKRYLAQL
jgi:hypothetical protein